MSAGPSPPGVELLRRTIAGESDVFAVRAQARRVAALLGFDPQDQIRIAVAMSEVGRRLVGHAGPIATVFTVTRVDGSGRSALGIRLVAPGPAPDGFVDAIGVIRSLMDRWEITHGEDETAVSMERALPPRGPHLDEATLAAIRAEVAALSAGTPMDELAENNRQLVATLEQVQAHRDELLRLNAELEETNRGVVALYNELSEELEATNRGVVALYAELDERTTQLREASEAKTRFLANVTHELRAPVTSIVGLARLLRDPSSDALTAEQTEQLGMVDNSARSLLALVNELLDLAKAESGRLQPAPEDADLKDVFDTLRGTLRALPTSGGAALVVDEPAGVPPLYTDPILLTQVLRNLLTNGLKFTPEGEVRLSAAAGPDGWVTLVVADTGIGIPAEEHERIFEEFHQVRNPLQASAMGTGLGLPYARRLVEILGGSIELASAPGEGSRFTVRLPARVPTVPADSVPPVTVLVVDDDEGFRKAAGGVLRACGFSVSEAADSRTALAAVAARLPDLVLLDLRLAETNGAGVLEALAADDRLRAVPVIVLSAYPRDIVGHPAADRALAVLDKTTTTLDDLCGIVISTVPAAGPR